MTKETEQNEHMPAGPRYMRCPFCGHEAVSYGIGAVSCGPHLEGGRYYPAKRMYEISSDTYYGLNG